VNERGQDGTGPSPDAPDRSEAERPPTAASDDAKARFREALERKRATTHRSAGGAAGGGSVHGPEVAATSRRVFRRKSG
jgi:hypothetical protein